MVPVKAQRLFAPVMALALVEPRAALNMSLAAAHVFLDRRTLAFVQAPVRDQAVGDSVQLRQYHWRQWRLRGCGFGRGHRGKSSGNVQARSVLAALDVDLAFLHFDARELLIFTQ